MTRHLFIIWSGLLLLSTTVGTHAQDHWAAIADTLARYSATSVYMYDDSIRQWLVDAEQAEGYQACYQHFYDIICQNSEKARQKGNLDDWRNLEFHRHYMACQQGLIDTETARKQMLQFVDDHRQEEGDSTLQHIGYMAILAQFLCETRRYAEAEQWCQRIDSLLDRGFSIYISHNCMKLQTLLAAQIGQGRLQDAWQTVLRIEERYSSYWGQEISALLGKNGIGPRLTTEATDAMQRLAPQLLMPILPPPPSAFTSHDMAPWPLSLTLTEKDIRRQMAFVLFNLHDLLIRLRLSADFTHKVCLAANKFNKNLYDYEMFAAVAPPISAELCRRTAKMAMADAEQCDTVSYPHNREKTEVMERWMHCMNGERLNYGERSATALLYFVGEWIKKGYVLTMLPLAEEAVATMERELADDRPTQRQLILQTDDRRWLADELPRMAPLVAHVPEYQPLVERLKKLRAEEIEKMRE